MLSIPSGVLVAGYNYTFRVLALMTNQPNLNSSATVVVAVEAQALMARISGGSYRQVNVLYRTYNDISLLSPLIFLLLFFFFLLLYLFTFLDLCSHFSFNIK